jgi:hypothetical protein
MLVEIPAMVDYPNHLARMSILARAGTASAHPLYEVAWAPYPNLAMDLLVPPLGRVIGIEAATKLFCLASLLLVVVGAMALAAAAKGSVLVSGLIACLFIHAMPFAFGFLNFTFGLGLALLASAAWIGMADRPLAWRLGLHAAAVVALFFSHLFALGLYGIFIGIVELWRMRQERPSLGRSTLLVLGMAAPVLALGVLSSAAGGSVGGTGTIWLLGSKFFWFAILNGWSRELSVLLTLCLAIPLALGFRRGWIRLVGPGPWLASGFALLFLAMPFRLFDTGFVDGRVLIFAILVLPAYSMVAMRDARWRRFAVALLCAGCLVSAGTAAWVQAEYRTEYRALLTAFDAMPRGAKLLPADRGEADDPPSNLVEYPMYHAATLAVHTRDAFVPTLFASPGKQPLRITPTFRDLAVLEGGPIPWRFLADALAGTPPPPALVYVRDWPHSFDYLLLLHPDGPALRPDLLEPVAAGRRFALYRIKRPSPPSTRP